MTNSYWRTNNCHYYQKKKKE